MANKNFYTFLYSAYLILLIVFLASCYIMIAYPSWKWEFLVAICTNKEKLSCHFWRPRRCWFLDIELVCSTFSNNLFALNNMIIIQRQNMWKMRLILSLKHMGLHKKGRIINFLPWVTQFCTQLNPG